MKNSDFVWLLRNAFHTHSMALLLVFIAPRLLTQMIQTFFSLPLSRPQVGGSTLCRLWSRKPQGLDQAALNLKHFDTVHGTYCKPPKYCTIASERIKDDLRMEWDIFWGSRCVKQLCFSFILRFMVLWTLPQRFRIVSEKNCRNASMGSLGAWDGQMVMGWSLGASKAQRIFWIWMVDLDEKYGGEMAIEITITWADGSIWGQFWRPLQFGLVSDLVQQVEYLHRCEL